MDNEVLQLEHEISTLIANDNKCTVHFKYSERYEEPLNHRKNYNSVYDISAYTVNPTTKETFLLKTISGASSHIKGLTKLLEYVKSQKELASFTVFWHKKGSSSQHISYFYCHDVTEAIEKFFTGKNKLDYTIFEIKLNPIA